MSTPIPFVPGLLDGTSARILALLYVDPTTKLHTSEIIRRLGGGRGAVQRDLKRLTAFGALRLERTGNLVQYSANRGAPFFGDLRGLLVKTVALAYPLGEALESLESKIAFAYVFGSIASGSAGAESDIDLMVIGDASLADVVSSTSALHQSLMREVNPMVYELQEFLRRAAEEGGFVKATLREPRIFLIGDESELDRLVSKRVAQEGGSRSKGHRGSPETGRKGRRAIGS